MFKWLRALLKKEQPDQYAVLARGKIIARTSSIEAAEQLLREQFNEIDARLVGGRSFGSHQGISYSARWKAFRGECRIIKQ
jgi:hypothetical protein